MPPDHQSSTGEDCYTPAPELARLVKISLLYRISLTSGVLARTYRPINPLCFAGWVTEADTDSLDELDQSLWGIESCQGLGAFSRGVFGAACIVYEADMSPRTPYRQPSRRDSL